MSNDWTEKQVLENICVTLTEILFELKHLNSADRTGAISSVEVKYTSPTKDNPSRFQPVVKVYAGSVPPVEEAVDSYAKTIQLAEERSAHGWAETLATLQAAQAAD